MSDLQPNAGAALDFLEAAFAHHEDEHDGALIEIAYCAPGKSAITSARLFENTAEGRREAAEFGARQSLERTSVYVAPALRKPGTTRDKRAKKVDILGAAMLWADFDEPGAVERGRNIYDAKQIAPHRIVVTGRAPNKRAQGFWFLDEVIEDQATVDELLAGVHCQLDFVTDPKVINIDRVMRLPGTLSWPKEGKDGRRMEVTELHRPGNAPAAPYSPDHAETLFPRRDPRAARKNQSAEPGLFSAPAADPSFAPPSSPPSTPSVASEAEFDAMGRRIDGREEYARDLLGGVIRNLAARLGRWPTAREIAEEAWHTYLAHVGVKRPIAGEDLSAGLEREGRGWSWFAEKCETHARRAADAAIPGLETIEQAKAQAAKAAQSAPVAGAASLPAAPGQTGLADATPPPVALTGAKAIERIRPLPNHDPRTFPRRRWLYGRHLSRGFVSALIAPGGVGKSSLAMVEALAMVTGRNLLGDWCFGKLRVWFWNGEDPVEESDRRALAAMQRYGVKYDDVSDRLFLDSGRDVSIEIATEVRGGAIVNEHVVESIVARAIERELDVIIVDPFVSSHMVNENDNGAIDAVVKTWNRIASEAACAVMLVHHSRKPPGGHGPVDTGADDARGAGAFLGAVRSARVLNRMSKEDAERYQIGDRERQAHIRVDPGKNNLARPSDDAQWFRLEEIYLPNGEAFEEHGDAVGVPVRWDPPSLFEGVTTDHVIAVRRMLAAPAEGEGYRLGEKAGDLWAAVAIGDVIGLDMSDKAARRRAGKLLYEWLKTEVLEKREGVKNPATRHKVTEVRPGPNDPSSL